jgi:hypothetical protein
VKDEEIVWKKIILDYVLPGCLARFKPKKNRGARQ